MKQWNPFFQKEEKIWYLKYWGKDQPKENIRLFSSSERKENTSNQQKQKQDQNSIDKVQFKKITPNGNEEKNNENIIIFFLLSEIDKKINNSQIQKRK